MKENAMNRRALLATILFTAIIGFVPNAICQPNNIEHIGMAQINMDSYHFAVTNGYIYSVTESSLTVIDISDPDQPENVGFVLLEGDIFDLDILGDFIFMVGRFDGMMIYDISNRVSPVLVASYPLANWASEIEIIGPYVYLSGQYSSFQILDVSTPAEPAFVGEWGESVNAFHVQGDDAYLSADGNFHVLDISDLANPVSLGSFHPGYFLVIDIHAQSQTVYASADTDHGAIFEIDVSDPFNPHLVTTHTQYGGPYSIEIVDSYMFYTTNRLYAMRISPAGDLIQIGIWEDSGIYLQIIDEVAYMCGGGGPMRAVDVSDPSSMIELISFPLPRWESRHMDLHGDNAFVAARDNGVLVYDVSDPTSPEFVTRYELQEGESIQYITVQDNIAYISNWDGVRILDVSDILNPVHIGTADCYTVPEKVVREGDHLYVCHHLFDEDSFSIYNVANIENPVLLGSILTADHPFDFEVEGNYAYLALDREGMLILDISVPSFITQTMRIDIEGHATDIAVHNGYAYVDADGLYVFDISDPFNPVEVFWMGTPRVGSLEIEDNYLYAECSETDVDGFRVFRIEDPEDIVEVGLFSDYGHSFYDMKIRDGLVYTVGDLLHIYDVTGITSVGELSPASTLVNSFTLFNAYPNPFNASTMITVGLPVPSNLTVQAFNLNGQLVATLFDGYRQAGLQTFSLDATSFASGVYFIRATAPDQLNTMQKVTLIR
jgi:hypothetical protein